MNVKIYPGQLESAPLEEYEWIGSVHDFFVSQGAYPDSKDVQPVSVWVNGVFCEDWNLTYIDTCDILEIRPNPKAAAGAIAAWVYFAVAAIAVIVAISMRPNVSAAANRQQGRNLSAADTTANVAKPNQVVPELIGSHIRYPDYLTPPRRYFQDKRTQYMETLLCIGPGTYDVEQVRIGNTPFAELDGTEYWIHQPGEEVLFPTNWYSAPEVGPTSGGTAGLELTAIPEDQVNPSTTATYSLNAKTITFPASGAPQSWGIGTSFSLTAAMPVSVVVVTDPDPEITTTFNGFSANFDLQNSSVGQMVNVIGIPNVASARIGGPVTVGTTSYMTLEFYVSDNEGGESWQKVSGLPAGTRNIGLSNQSLKMTVASINDATRQVTFTSNLAWDGFSNRSTSLTSWSTDPSTVFGESVGPYVICPPNEIASRFEIDFFFPQGLCDMSDGGDLKNRSVAVEISYKDHESGPWTSVLKTYTDKTVDQIGFTEVIDAGLIRPTVRIRRRGARSTDSAIQDNVQWYGARSLLRSPATYAGWTTISVRVKGLGQIANTSENQVNLIATRRLQNINSTTGPTLDISAGFLHVLRSSGYPMENIDSQALRDLHTLWTSRSEFANAVFDDGTVGSALDKILMAGMAEYTIENGLIRPVRESVRTIADHEQVFSDENATSFSRTFTAIKPDANDGVEVEFQDAADGYATKKIVCKLPDSLGIKLERMKLTTVTDKNQAYRIGMRRAGEQRYRRWQYQWATELDARNASYKGYQLLIPEVSTMGQSVIVEAVSYGVVYVSQPLQWTGSNVFGLRGKDGRLIGPFPATRYADDAISTNQNCQPGDVLFFGKANKVTHHVLTTKISVNGNKTTATGVNYDARIYQYDNATAPE